MLFHKGFADTDCNGLCRLNGYALFNIRGNGGHGLSFEQSTTRAIGPRAHRSAGARAEARKCAELPPLGRPSGIDDSASLADEPVAEVVQYAEPAFAHDLCGRLWRRGGVSREGGLPCCFDSLESYGQAGRDSLRRVFVSPDVSSSAPHSRCALARKNAGPARAANSLRKTT